MDTFVKWFLIVCFSVLLLYKYGTRKYKHWTKKGLKQLKPVPFLGDNYLGMFRIKNVLEICETFYKPFKGERFGGLYINQTPFLSVTDPELLKLIFVKDADHFINRYDWFKGSDPLLSKNLFNLRDENWKKMRTVMTTVFTSAKMKDMFGFMEKCAQQSAEYLKEKIADSVKCGESEGTIGYEVDCRDFFSRYGTDVIGSTAFGIEVDSFKNPNNEFYKSGLIIRNLFTGIHLLKILFVAMFPNFSKKIGITLMGKKYNKFFISLIEEAIREREKNNIIRKDVIHILMEARKGKGVNENGELIKGKLPDLTDVDIAAQAIVFFFAGFESMALLLSFASYELAVNPDIQEKLQKEIDEVIERENGITYDAVIHKMQFLHMVIHETLRKWPLAATTDREVSKTYTIPKKDSSPELVLNKGDIVWVSIGGLHYDPEYFPDPNKFDPERFRDEKNTIKPFTYLPFGEGIRHCIGMRYALMEVKTILVHLLRNFNLAPSKKTLIPLKISKKKPFALESENGFWLTLTPRK